MLKTACTRFPNPKVMKPVDLIRALVTVALAHYDRFYPMLVNDFDYSKNEGFDLEDYFDGLIAGQRAKLAERKRKGAS